MTSGAVAVCRLGGWDPSIARFVLDRNNPTAGVLVPVGRIDTRTPRQAGLLVMEALHKGHPGAPSPTQDSRGLCQLWLEAYSIRHCVLWAAQRLAARALEEFVRITTQSDARLTLIVTDCTTPTLSHVATTDTSAEELVAQLAGIPTTGGARQHPRLIGGSTAAAFETALAQVNSVLRSHPAPTDQWLVGLTGAGAMVREAAVHAAGAVLAQSGEEQNAAHLGALGGAARHGWRWDLPDVTGDLRCLPGHQYWPALRRYRSTQPAALIALAANGVSAAEALHLTNEQVTPDLVELGRGPVPIVAPDAQAAISAHLNQNAALRKRPAQFLAEHGRRVTRGQLVATARRSVEVLGADLLPDA
jgi:hypothetical protein